MFGFNISVLPQKVGFGLVRNKVDYLLGRGISVY